MPRSFSVHDVVAGEHVALLVHHQAAVGVAVVGEAHVQVVVQHELLERFDVGRAHAFVDVRAVGLRAHHEGACAQRLEHSLGDHPGRAVGAVQAHPQAAEAVQAVADQVAHVAVAAADVVHRLADVLLQREGQLLHLLAEHVQLAVQVILDQPDGVLAHLLAVAVQQLYAIVVERIVAGRDHDAAVELVGMGDPGHAGRGGDVEHVGVRAAGRQARDQRVFKHVGRAAGVLADDDLRVLPVAGEAPLLGVVPAQEAPHLVGVVRRQCNVGLPPEAVGAEIFAHGSILSLVDEF